MTNTSSKPQRKPRKKSTPACQPVTLDILGRLDGTSLSRNRGIHAVFEAVTNSIHAIEDSASSSGNVLINLHRNDCDFMAVSGIKELSPVHSVTIKDNGVGFTDPNYAAFCKAHTRNKKARGGKGVGRFLWLKVFEKASVLSRFVSNEKRLVRSFDFTPSGIERYEMQPGDFTHNYTEISLRSVSAEYSKHLPIDLLDWANQIIQHHIPYLLNANCPRLGDFSPSFP